ncbi:hypothetical protein TAMYLO_740005 [Tenacibaculum amylolyticum]
MTNSFEPNLIADIIQITLQTMFIVVIFLIFKLYFLITKYLKVKTKYFENKINE